MRNYVGPTWGAENMSLRCGSRLRVRSFLDCIFSASFMTISALERAVAALFTRQPGARAVDCRSMRLVFIEYICRPFPWRVGSRESSNAENDNWAISVCDICTVVSGGAMNWASLMSSNPTTDKSCGILRRRSNAARITPMAVISFEQSTAEGRSGMAARADNAFMPASIV